MAAPIPIPILKTEMGLACSGSRSFVGEISGARIIKFAGVKMLSFLMLVPVLSCASYWAFSRLKVDAAPVVVADQIRRLQVDQTQQDQFVVVDVRSKAETDVSMIPGAITKSEFEESAREHQGKTIIVYCTVGVRSGKYAAKLNQKGWEARNYKGSILDWCQRELLLKTRDGKKTNQVHTYSAWYSVPQNYVAVH